jgi:hypothetical protein
METIDLDKAAAALFAQYGKRAITVAEDRASRHESAKDMEASQLWQAVALALRRKASHTPQRLSE